MTERAAVFAAALLIVALALLAMAGMHERHYQQREWKLLRARLDALEGIVVGKHD